MPFVLFAWAMIEKPKHMAIKKNTIALMRIAASFRHGSTCERLKIPTAVAFLPHAPARQAKRPAKRTQ
jgi:hypothetical protein